MNKELIEKIVKFALQWNNTWTRLDFERFLTKHLKDKVIVEKKVLEEMIEKREKQIYNEWYKITEFLQDIKSLLDNQE